MQEMYARVFQSMYSGSMYGAGSVIFAVWGWILGHHDQDGFVEINSAVLADILGDPKQKVDEAITYLANPDPESRSKACDGRRIEHIEAFLYYVVNHKEYDKIRKSEDRRSQNRESQARFKTKNADSKHTVINGKHGSAKKPPLDLALTSTSDKNKRTKKGETKACFTPDSPAFSLATLLHDQLTAESLLARKPDLQKWAGEIDRMLRIDKIPAADIEAVIEWLPTDPARGTWPGWGYVIRSTKKLREKWEDLIVQYATATKSSSAKIPYKKCDQCKKPADVLVGDYDTPYCRLCRPNVFAAKYPEEN